jgi:glucose-1-phosphate cytidylyltransferase
MKVVLFCGGLGTRLRDYSDQLPKPLVPIGSRPVLWHLMRYYAHHGHTDFILCLGFKGAAIKRFFQTYDECVSNDFVFSEGGRKIELMSEDIKSWRITFVDTGQYSSIGERLRRVRKLVENEEVFLANYADGLSDLNCQSYLDWFMKSGKLVSFLSVRVPQTFHIVRADAEGHALELEDVRHSSLRINGGFFAMRPQIFDYMREGEELVVEPFERLIAERQLLAFPYDGFWRNMDTFRDKMELDDIYNRGRAPWQVWLP